MVLTTHTYLDCNDSVYESIRSTSPLSEVVVEVDALLLLKCDDPTVADDKLPITGIDETLSFGMPAVPFDKVELWLG